MSTKTAIVRESDGEVTNVILLDQGSDFDPGEGFTLIDAEGEQVGPGWTWDGSDFIEPTTEDPIIWDRPGVVDRETQGLIGEKYREKGGEAITAADAIQANSNIPQEVKDWVDAMMALQYLTYVSLTGDRISTVEEKYFG